MRPAVSVFCRCTRMDLHSFLRKPVSSITTTARERQAPPGHRHTTHFSRCRNPTLLDLTHVACHMEWLLPPLPPPAIRFFVRPRSSIPSYSPGLADATRIQPNAVWSVS